MGGLSSEAAVFQRSLSRYTSQSPHATAAYDAEDKYLAPWRVGSVVDGKRIACQWHATNIAHIGRRIEKRMSARAAQRA